MPPTATPENLEEYLRACQKGKITPERLPPCPRCNVESLYFKFHAYRERIFLIIVDMVIRPIRAYLLRFCCPGCGKTFTYYPDFAIPYKRYTRQTITGFAERYVDSDNTYEQTVMDKDEMSVPGYAESDKVLAPSTVHRWVTSLGRFVNTTQKALDLICQENPKTTICRDLAQWVVPPSKYKSEGRRKCLFNCFRFLAAEAVFKTVFHLSIFTKLAIRYAFV
jgi:hypothetical protein